MSFAGRVIAVTGAAQGIGRGVARLLAARGATLAISDVKKPELEATTAGIQKDYPGAKIHSSIVDIRNTNSVNGWISSVKSRFGHLDGAVNNAGVLGKCQDLIKDLKDEDWDFVIGCNLTGTMKCLRAELGHMEKGGAIVNIASIAGLMGVPAIAPYISSKHGLIGLTRTAAKEAATQDVRVNVVCPGTIKTPMLDDIYTQMPSLANMAALGRDGTPEEIASVTAFLLSPDSSYVTGAAYVVDGGWVC